ncbi:hypothetical protein [Paraburkholderia fungorum]|uniref:hypothetical protein n=1 Tax=Paraburkholderia fungorum TaxID=134537 RepID=UPI00161489CF|nr:hypothetical protein [Paraburkholderia fungorum]MBB5546587.1 hypothetical protein [Paraburkholderia fungorum]
MTMKFSGCAPEVIAGRPEGFEGTEIEGVRECDGHCEVDNETPEFFSVYLRLKPDGDDVGVRCVGDFEAHGDAAAYAENLARQYGWRIGDKAQVPA